MRCLFALVLVAACGHAAAPPPSPKGPTAEESAVDAAIVAFFSPHLDFRPNVAIDLGMHDHDGRVPDRSPAAIAAEIDRLHAAQPNFDSYLAMPPSRFIDASLVRGEIHRELFDLEVRRRPWRDPIYYLRNLTLSAYVARDYAPLAERAYQMWQACEATPKYLAQADANLEPAIPRAWIEMSRMMITGLIGFVTTDVPAAFAGLHGDPLKEEDPSRIDRIKEQLDDCLPRLADALKTFDAALEARLPAATTDFALGEDTMTAMLREAEGLDLDLATIEAAVRADLDRNVAAITAAAAQIDPARPARDVIADVTADAPADAIAEATADLTTLRAFVVDHDLVTIPRDETIEVREAPSYFRGNFAFLSSGGPFEPVPQPNFFYFALPFPMSRADLLFIAAHEVWPGHLVQGMHERASADTMRQAFETYTTSEGWAHYVEEMMWDAGLGDGDPTLHIGQLKNALLRDVRALVAIGLHARGMTIDDAIALFADEAFADPVTAKQQAMRGTMDPMYLSYTLGKLIIRKLRDDWRAQTGGTLKEFHDAFLANGEAPLPAIRRAMLGSSDSGELLGVGEQ